MYKIILNQTRAIKQTNDAMLIQFTTDLGKFTSWVPKSMLIINAKLNLLLHSSFIATLKTEAGKFFKTEIELIKFRK